MQGPCAFNAWNTLPEQFSLAEENSVLLASQHGNDVCFGIWRRIRLKLEARLFRGPTNRGASAKESAFELLRVVFNLCCREGAIPLHVERDFRAHPRRSRDRRIEPNHGKP